MRRVTALFAVRHSLAALVALLALTSLFSAAPRRASASCGSENCPVDHAGRWDEAGLSFELFHQYIDQDSPRVGTHDATVGEIPTHHDEVRTVNRITTARLSYRPSQRWSVSAALPFVNRTHEHIHNHGGVPFYLRWNYHGVGDLETAVARSFGGGTDAGSRYFASAGVKAPTGVRNVEEVDGDQPEPSARPGTGSWDVLAGIGAEWKLGSGFADRGGVPLRASVNGRWNGKGTERYQVGGEVAAHLAAEIPVVERGALLLQTNFRVRAKDDVGDVNAEAGNTGGTALYVSPGVRVDAGRNMSIYGLVQVPVYQRVNGIQIVSDRNWYVGVTHALMR